MKKHHAKRIFKKLLLFLPIIIMLIVVNLIGDPANIFTTGKYEKGMIEIIYNGYNIGNVIDYDERLFQKFYIEELESRNEVIVLGSSRSMQIDSKLFQGKSFFNNAVSGCSLEDYLAIYEIYEANNLKPDLIILGVDPWMFNKNNGQFRWKSIGQDYYKLKNKIEKGKRFEFIKFKLFVYKAKRYSQIFLISYFQRSVERIIKKIKTKEKHKTYFKTLKVIDDSHIKLKDGSFNYNLTYQNQTEKEIFKRAQKYVNQKPLFALGSFKNIDSGLKKNFEGFINYLKINNIKVIIFLPSYHPSVYEKIKDNEDYKMVNQVENYIYEFAQKEGLTVIGSYDPLKMNYTCYDFYDGMHLKREKITSLFKKISID